MVACFGGHGDYRPLNAALRPGAPEAQAMEKAGVMTLADGLAEVLAAAREQLRRGAASIKIATGGAVASQNDPLGVVEYAPKEFARP